jgi:capsular exopolysaccharide synthesis family protein
MARKKDQRVLLVDGDLRRPTLAKTFGLGQLSGLSECLKKGTPPRESIYFLEDLGFWFLPAGTQADNALELMQSGGLAEIFKKLSRAFDWIIIDSPPLLPLADTTFWLRIADGTMLVARRGTTEKRQLERGVECLDKITLLGVVLNSSSSADNKNYYQRYGYGSPPSEEANSVNPAS